MRSTHQTTPSIAQQRDYLRRQQEGFAIMERERREQLVVLDHAQNLPLLDGLLSFAYQYRQPQPTSGMVELQRILLKQRTTP